MKNLIRKNSLTGILAFLMFLTMSVTGKRTGKNSFIYFGNRTDAG